MTSLGNFIMLIEGYGAVLSVTRARLDGIITGGVWPAVMTVKQSSPRELSYWYTSSRNKKSYNSIVFSWEFMFIGRVC